MAKKQATPNGPERKFGPYAGGISVAVWLNTIQTDDGERHVRSVSISPRRYRDPQSGEWRDSYSYRANDLPIIMHGLQQAWKYVLDTPLPGQSDDG